MCIIVYKPKNVKLPDRKILRNCYLNNDDGAGYMFVDNGKVQIRKGFDDFNQFYKSVINDYKFGNSMILHFRISTSGGINAGATHPFPLSYSFEEMKKTTNECNVGIAHNGVIRLTEPTTTESSNGINDTMKFIKTYMNIFLDSGGKDRLTPKDINLINNMTNSKLAILYNDDSVQLTNILAWKEQDGVYYSNDSFSYRIVYNYKTVNDAIWYSNYDSRYYDYDGWDTTTSINEKKTKDEKEESKEKKETLNLTTPEEDDNLLPDNCALLYAGDVKTCKECKWNKYCFGDWLRDNLD